MAFTLEDGSGVAGANAFCSVAFADALHLDLGNTTWTGIDAVKQQAIILASRYLVGKYHVRWIGTRFSQTQGLDWPRFDATDFDGFLRPSDSVPNEVAEACAILALRSLTGDNLQPDQTAGSYGIKREKVRAAVIEEDKTYISSKPTTKRYDEVQRLLRPVLTSRRTIERA